jgi:hypothetical protein
MDHALQEHTGFHSSGSQESFVDDEKTLKTGLNLTDRLKFLHMLRNFGLFVSGLPVMRRERTSPRSIGAE